MDAYCLVSGSGKEESVLYAITVILLGWLSSQLERRFGVFILKYRVHHCSIDIIIRVSNTVLQERWNCKLMLANKGIKEGKLAKESALREIEEGTMCSAGMKVGNNDTSVTM